MSDSPIPESDAFDPLKIFALVFAILGWLFLAGGLFTLLFGFRLDYKEYSGLLPGLGFMLPGLTLVGLARIMSGVATVGMMARETLLRAERLIAKVNEKS